MKKSKRITINLTPEEIKEALIGYYLEKDEKAGAKIEFKVAKETRGYGMSEYDEVVFNGADIVVEQ